MTQPVPENSPREDCINDAIAEYLRTVEAGQAPVPERWLARHADLADDLRSFLADRSGFQRIAHEVPAVPHAAIVAEPPTLAVGETGVDPGLGTVRYFGDYELVKEIARGGMGVVFMARQVSLNRIVALKMILAGQLATPGDVQRFRMEAEAAANLDHPNIVPIYEVGEHAGQHFFSMKYVEGGSLASRGRQPPEEAARLVALVARAVHHAHQRGILHRDLKPGNVLIDRGIEPHVTDFGLARKVEGDSGMTQTGAIVGTPSYMPPEQARAEKGLTTAADVYSLGAILYECLTGQPPFSGPTPLETLMQVLEREPLRPRGLNAKVDRDLETICLKCLEKEAERRYASALALAEDLERWQRGEPIAARPVGNLGRAWRWCRRKPALAALSAVVIATVPALLALTVVIAATFRNAARESRERLFESLLSQAEAERRAGDRTRSLELFHEAVQIRRTDRARREAIQTIVSAGVRWVAAMPSGENPKEMKEVFGPVFSSDGKLVAYTGEETEWDESTRTKHKDGSESMAGNTKPVLRVCRFPSGQLVARRRDFCVPLAFRPNTSHLLIANGVKGGPIRLWDPITAKEVANCQGVNPVFSANGNYLATVDGKQVRLWNLAGGPNPKAPPRGVPLRFLAPNELLLADQTGYRRWDFTQGRDVFATPKGLSGLGVSDSGRLAVLRGRTAQQSRVTLLLWDLVEGKQVAELPGLERPSTSIAFSRDEKQLAIKDSSSKKLTILVWDLTTRSLVSRLSSRGIQSSYAYWDQNRTWGVPAPSFSPDGSLLAARGFRGGRPVLCVWDIESGSEVKVMPEIGYCWWRDDGRTLVTLGQKIGGEDANWGNRLMPAAGGLWQAMVEKTPPGGHVNLWEVTHPTPTYQVDAIIQHLSVNTDGSRLAVNDIVWEVRKNPEGVFLRRAAIPADGLQPVFVGQNELWAVIPGGRSFATIQQLAPQTRTFVFPAPTYPDIEKRIGKRLTGREATRATRITLSPDGTLALIAVEPQWSLRDKKGGWKFLTRNLLELWDVANCKRRALWSRRFHGEHWMCFQFSPDGKRVVTSSDRGLKVWDVSSGKVERTMDDRTTWTSHPVDQLAFSRDGKRVLAVASANPSARSWAAVFDVETGEEVRSWVSPGKEADWKSSAFSPDGRWVALGREDGQIRLLDVGTGRELVRWDGHEAGVTALRILPDGNTLVSGSKEGTLKLWNLPFIRKELGTLGLDWDASS